MLEIKPLSPEFLPPAQLPRRSRTLSAWGALLALIFVILLGIFYPLFLRESVRLILWATRPITGLTIQSQELSIQLGQPLIWKKIILTSGKFPHESRCEFQSFSIQLNSAWRMIFGDHLIVSALEASNGQALIDLRGEEGASNPSLFQKMRTSVFSLLEKEALLVPSSITLNHVSCTLLTEHQSDTIEGLSLLLAKKNVGTLSYDSILIEAAPLRCELAASSCTTSWNKNTVTLNNLSLSKEIQLRSLQLTPHADRIELGIVSTLFHGLLRADGCLKKKNSSPWIEGAVLAQRLPMERLSKFLGLTKKISGNLREGRLIFRGAPLRLADAEASLRILADDFRYGRKAWETLSMTANLINHKISLNDFQLRQQENHLTAAGEMTLPNEWHKIGKAPFHCKIKATISDATQLADLAGPPWNDITGALSIESDIQGADHQAQGYLKVQGIDMGFQGLSINNFNLNVLFQGDKTTISSCDLSHGASRFQISGVVANNWPHHYEGTASLQGSHFLKLGGALGVTPLQGMSAGTMQAHWKGQGDTTAHQGVFDLLFSDLQKDSYNLSGRCSGSYTPEEIVIPTFVLQEGTRKLTLQTTFSLKPDCIELTHGLALIGEGTMSATGKSTGPWNNLHHDYRFSGTHLLFYQTPRLTLKGDADLSLQGDQEHGKLKGTITLQDAFWKPSLTFISCFLPTFILTSFEQPPRVSTSQWSSDIAIINQPYFKKSNQIFGAMNLHLVGSIFAPVPEGSCLIHDCSITSRGVHFLDEMLFFNPTEPWKPENLVE